MGIFDPISGGPDSLEPEDRDDDGNELEGTDADLENDDDDDDGDDDADTKRKRRNRPSQRRRNTDRMRTLESKFDQLVSLIEKGGLAVNAPKDTDAATGVDVDKLRRDLEAEITGKANQRVIRSEARSALREAGFLGDPKRGVRMLDLEGIDPDDEDALADEIEALKEESPELFGRSRRSSRRTRDDRDDDGDDDRGRLREPRTARSRERMTRGTGSGGQETDALATSLLGAVGGSRQPRR